jgi:hypothetical protein
LCGGQEFLFHQSQAGTVPEEVWERWSDTTAWWLTFPGVRSWWLSRPTPFSASFTSYIDALLERAPIRARINVGRPSSQRIPRRDLRIRPISSRSCS